MRSHLLLFWLLRFKGWNFNIKHHNIKQHILTKTISYLTNNVCQGLSRAGEKDMSCQLSIKTTSQNETNSQDFNHLLWYFKQEVKPKKAPTPPLLFSPCWRSVGSAQSWAWYHRWGSLEQKVPIVLWTQRPGARERECLRVGKYWELSQNGEKCLQVFPPLSPC